jgi:hypothetical protein
VTIENEGTYTVDPTTGAVSFTPLPDFLGTATPVMYQVADSYLRVVSSTYTPTVTTTPPPPAAPAPQPEYSREPESIRLPEEDSQPAQPMVVPSVESPEGQALPIVAPQLDTTVVNPGDVVVLDPFAKGRPTPGSSFVKSSVRLWDGQAWVREVREPRIGTWTVKDGKVVFMPARDYVGTVKVPFRVRDSAGVWGRSTLTVIVTPVQNNGRLTILPKTGSLPLPLGLMLGLLVGAAGGLLLRMGLRRR